MIQGRSGLPTLVSALGLAFCACVPGTGPAASPYLIKYDLIQMVDRAQVTMPRISTIENIRFETGAWEFDRDGYIHLTRLSAARNRLTFEPELEGGPDGEIAFRYR